MLRDTATLLVAEGAWRFARDRGAELCDPAEMISPRREAAEAEPGHDTVGCVALDEAGNIAVATSTGGLSGKMPARVGDSPLPGCGLYADNALGGVCLSGDGESIARAMLAARVMTTLEMQDVQTAADRAIELLGRVGGEAGAIVLDRSGRFGWAQNSPHFAIAFATSRGGSPAVYLAKNEEVESRNG